MFSETWHTTRNISNLQIKGFKCYRCHRPKGNKRAKRNSGGLIIYYKEWLTGKIELVKTDDRGILWMKLKHRDFNFERDKYFCLAYIPPEDSRVYKNPNSNLFQFDFYQKIASDVLQFGECGEILLCGDFNARTGAKADFIDNLNLDRFVGTLPPEMIDNSPMRKSHDKAVNSFGNKLLSFCKDHEMLIVNGRLDDGQCTYHTVKGNLAGSSLVDYLVVDKKCLFHVKNFEVLDLNEFSDHCAIRYSFESNTYNSKNDNFCVNNVNINEKIVWDSEKVNDLRNLMRENENTFENIVSQASGGEISIDESITTFSNLLYDLSKETFGKKTTKFNNNIRNFKCPWFNEDCRSARSEFFRRKKQFKTSKSIDDKISFLKARYDYAYTKRKAKFTYQTREGKKLSEMSKSNSRAFWKNIKRLNNSAATDIPLSAQDFVEHFKNLSNGLSPDPPEMNENLNFPDSYIDDLDRPFTTDEVIRTISQLNRNKSPGFDNILPELFLDNKEFIAPYICILFNKIYDTGIYPEAWTKGIIVPIFKKGEKNNPSNYRGITLVNSLAKIFSLCLRNRLNKYCENNEIFTDFQFGFREKKNTVDCIFILHCLIQKILSLNKQLFCAFIDYEKCFDTINRDFLIQKLVTSGLSCKLIRMIKSLYNTVKSCIKVSNNSNLSEFIDIAVGLKQGEPLSPLLFILFLNDIRDSFSLGNLTQSDIEHLSVYMLMFADDMVLFTTDKKSLQKQLNDISEYAKQWGLKINVGKSKICIFERRKRRHNFTWSIDNKELEIVENFCYLGIKFSKNGLFKQAVSALHDQANRAMMNLFQLFKRTKFDIKTKIHLFDRLISPILLYAAEVWGIYGLQQVDRLHIKFCKSILGVHTQTPNFAVYGELGRYPLSIIAKERAMKYWVKVRGNDEKLIGKIYNEQNLITSRSHTLWVNKIRQMLNNTGLSYLLEKNNLSNLDFLLIQRRLRDNFIQEWHSSINNCSKLEYYCMFKNNFEYEPYLDNVFNESLRIKLAQFRLASHKLEIEMGRILNIDRSQRICKLCDRSVVESEYHFLCICGKFGDLRTKYLSCNRPNISKFIRILSSKNKRIQINTAKFIKEALQRRKSLITLTNNE